MAFKRRAEPTTIEDEREALRAQHAALEDLKRQLAERVDAVRERELELHHALAEAGSAPGRRRPSLRRAALPSPTRPRPTPARTPSRPSAANGICSSASRRSRSARQRSSSRSASSSSSAHVLPQVARRCHRPTPTRRGSPRSKPGSPSCATPRSSSSARATSSPPAARPSQPASASSRSGSASSTTARTGKGQLGRPGALGDGGAPAPAREHSSRASRRSASRAGCGSSSRERARNEAADALTGRYPVGARGVSSAGRAPPLQGGGRRFDPGTLHHRNTRNGLSPEFRTVVFRRLAPAGR